MLTLISKSFYKLVKIVFTKKKKKIQAIGDVIDKKIYQT